MMRSSTGDSFADPVFVLCNGRSGSTLLRFLLDAHPDIACPPETNLPALCAQLATVWSLIEGAPLSANRGDEPPIIPDAAIAGVRETVNRMVGSYLERRGKKRYCDKSLGTARFAELLLRVFPEARFLCLYRHPMDVIASGMEACPFGLSGYGFEPYISATPGNTVLALARFWADHTTAALGVEERFPDRSLRVRYEDLVIDPENTVAGILEFLGAASAPGISTACFSTERERFGPGDHKIWFTSAVSSGSVGRGWSIPAAMIAPQVLATVNELAAALGYVQVDGGWGTSAPPADLRVTGVEAGESRPGLQDGLAHSHVLGSHLRAGIAHVRVHPTDRWKEPYAHETAVAVSIPADSRQPADYWLIDLGARTVTFSGCHAQENSDWDIVGSAAAWDQVMAGTLNISAAMRSYQLRYCDNSERDDPIATDIRISMLADLLGLTTW